MDTNKQNPRQAFDYMDILTEKLRFYNVCRAKPASGAQGGHCNCGLAFPAKIEEKHMVGDSTVKER
eukprot:12366171-Prorocentrum_lima.AAC.1